MGFPMEDRYQLMSLQYLPVGKDQPVPLIIKFDKITGQAWTLQPSPGGKGFQFTAVRQPGAPIPGIVGGITGGGVAQGGVVVPGDHERGPPADAGAAGPARRRAARRPHGVRPRVSKIGKISKFCKFLAGAFSAVSKRNFARKIICV